MGFGWGGESVGEMSCIKHLGVKGRGVSVKKTSQPSSIFPPPTLIFDRFQHRTNESKNPKYSLKTISKNIHILKQAEAGLNLIPTESRLPLDFTLSRMMKEMKDI